MFSGPSQPGLDPKGSQGRGVDGPATPRVDRTRNPPRLEKCTLRYGGRKLAAFSRHMFGMPETDREQSAALPRDQEPVLVQGPELTLSEKPSFCPAKGWAVGERREKASSDFGEPFLAGSRQSAQHALRRPVSACRARRRVSPHPGRCHCRWPQSRNGHACVCGGEVQDAPAILPLRDLAARERATQTACACRPVPEGITLANFTGGPAEASSCIGAGGPPNRRPGFLQAPRPRQPPSAIPGL